MRRRCTSTRPLCFEKTAKEERKKEVLILSDDRRLRKIKHPLGNLQNTAPAAARDSFIEGGMGSVCGSGKTHALGWRPAQQRTSETLWTHAQKPLMRQRRFFHHELQNYHSRKDALRILEKLANHLVSEVSTFHCRRR